MCCFIFRLFSQVWLNPQVQNPTPAVPFFPLKVKMLREIAQHFQNETLYLENTKMKKVDSFKILSFPPFGQLKLLSEFHPKFAQLYQY